MRRRSRLIAVTIVAVCAGGSLAYGDFTVTMTPSSGGSGSMGTTMRTVVSVRNNLPDPVTATILGSTSMAVACAGERLTDIDGAEMPQWTFPGHGQRQFVIGGSFTSSGTKTCTWTVDAGAGNSTSFTTTFEVGTGPDPLNVQPAAFLFAGAGSSETQTALVQNYVSTPSTYMSVTIDDGGTGVLRFDGGPCDGLQTCAGTTILPGSYQELDYKCTPPPTGEVSGTITYMIGASAARTQAFTCRQSGQPPDIDITQPMLALQGTQGVAVTATANITSAIGTNSIQSAAILGTDAGAFRIVAPTPACNGTQTCTFTPAQPITATTTLTVECTPTSSQKTATLRVRGTAHANDLDEALLTCVADGGVSATPTELAFGDVKVTTTSAPQTLAIQNLSTTMQASVQLDTGHPDWLVSACDTEPCTIAPGGSQEVEVRFQPSLPAQNDRMLTVQLNGTPAATVQLRGHGVGSQLRVTSHQSPYLIDFGTIGLGTARNRTITLHADGNRSLNVAIGTPAGPYMVSAPAIDLAAGAEGSFVITCQSATPGTFMGMATLMPGPADHVYASDTPKLDVRCQVANTPVQVTPDDIDFGEVRRNTPPPTIDVQIHNPSASPIPIDHVRLANEGPLSISAPNDGTLDPGETINASISLATTAEVTVESALEVGVGGEQLVTPITGKVVTASARVSPTELRLGSVCVGTMVEEPVRLVNSGTARLRAQPPTMTDPFAVLFVDPISYPPTGALLEPLDEAVATVRLATSSTGRVSGKLTWDVDAPEAPFVIDASLDVKDAGVAVSPVAIGFDQVRIHERSDRRTIRLENCGDVASEVALTGVSASRGSEDAWELTPPRFSTRLAPGEKLAIEVRFAPTRRGPHVAMVELAVDGVPQPIELIGDAFGVERDSLYACSCSSPGAPLHALPLAAVILFVVSGRRRTGSS